MKSEVGITELIGHAGDRELTSAGIKHFLLKNTVDEETNKRLSAWQSEFEFWEKNTVIYPYMELGFHSRRLVEAMEEFVEPRGGQIWLDAGCGPGKMSELIWRKSGSSVKKIIGIDITLKPAQQRAREIPVLELEYGNLGERLRFNDQFFDGIVSNIAIPYTIEFEGIPGKEGIQLSFSELARVLRPGGQLIWSSPRPNMRTLIGFLVSVPDIVRNIRRIPNIPIIAVKLLKYSNELKRKGKQGVYTYLSPPEWDEMLERAGFVNSTWKFVFTHQVWVNRCHKKTE